MPTLEISADDIACSHGASVTDLDDNSVFYLAARGISRLVFSALLKVFFLLTDNYVTFVCRRPAESCYMDLFLFY